MDVPRFHHRSQLEPPEICIQSISRDHPTSRSASYSSGYSPSRSTFNMPIPSTRNSSPPPPPLPPPKFPELESNANCRQQPESSWNWNNSEERNQWRGSVTSFPPPGSSLFGSLARNRNGSMDSRPDLDRRGSSASTIKSTSAADPRVRGSFSRFDEGYSSFAGASYGSRHSSRDDSNARPDFLVHDKFQRDTSSYDNSVLKKLDTPRRSDNTSPPRDSQRHLSISLEESGSARRFEDRPQLQHLSLPAFAPKAEPLDSPLSQWQDIPTSAVSPRAEFTFESKREYRSPVGENSERLRSALALRPSGLKIEDECNPISRLRGGSYDHGIPGRDSDFPAEETSGLRHLQIDDRLSRGEGYSPNSTGGLKRRASSPPREEHLPSLHTAGSAGDLFRRRESTSRSSPVPRIHSNHGSVSSTTSGRNNSYASTASLAPTVSTMSSYGRLSQSGLSPGGMQFSGLSPGGVFGGGLSPGANTTGGLSPRTPDDITESPYPSPRGSISRPIHHRTASYETRTVMSSRKPSTDTNGLNHQAEYVCECCPKKPKKFDTPEELSAHEQEKQYECAYCKNRFKNKNEAERHQNSLHLRRHSWSCAALTGYHAVFHVSPTTPAGADTCGYCGEEFGRSGPIDLDRNVKVATERDWDTRIQHLLEVHKFGECNHAKKFFRADHFRQHLKHSHAGTSGKWTNMLENACMKDEPLPVPRIREEEEIS